MRITVTGERDFGTGAKRDPNQDKGRYDLLSPLFLRRLAVHTQKGGQIRGDRNWEQGMPISAALDSALRHVYKHIEGMRDEDHLAAAAWNIMVAIHMEEMIERGLMHDELNDLPNYLDMKFIDVTPGEVYPDEPDNHCGNCKYSTEGAPDPYFQMCMACSRLSNHKYGTSAEKP